MTRRLFDARLWHKAQCIACEREEEEEREAGNTASVAQKDKTVRVTSPAPAPRLATKNQREVVDYSSFFTDE